MEFLRTWLQHPHILISPNNIVLTRALGWEGSKSPALEVLQ